MFRIDDTTSEKALLEALQSSENERAAFSHVFDLYHAAVYKNAMRVLQDADQAEDIVQETFIYLWMKRNELANSASLAGWLFKVSYHKSIDLVRKNVLQTAALSVDLAEEESNILVLEQEYAALQSAIAQLSPQKRKVVELCKLKGYSYKQAAEEMGISRFTVNEYLKESMAFLKQHIKEQHTFYCVMLTILLSRQLH